MKVLCVQSPRMPIEKVGKYLESLKKNISILAYDLMVLPEKWITTEFEDGDERLSEVLQKFMELSESTGAVFVPGSFSIRRNGSLFNSSPVIDHGQILGFQDKISLFQNENGKYSRGKDVMVFHAGKVPFSVAVCYDLDFPFFAKMAIEKGAQFLVNPSLILSDFKDMWHLYVKGRSLENRLAVISVNSVTEPFFGGSIVTALRPYKKGIMLESTQMGEEPFMIFETNPGEMENHIRERKREDAGTYGLSSGSS